MGKKVKKPLVGLKAKRKRDDSENGSEDETHSQRYVPDEFSIDRLLEERESERVSSQQMMEEKKEEEPEKLFNDPISLSPVISRDGSIFDLSQGSFPISVFDMIGSQREVPSKIYPTLSEYQWECLKIHPDLVEPSESTYFSIVQSICSLVSDEFGPILIRYASRFPPSCIDFETWLDYTSEAIISYAHLSIFILASAPYKIFVPSDAENNCDRIVKLILLYVSAALCPLICESPYFGRVIENMSYLFTCCDLGPERTEFLCSSCLSLAQCCRQESVSAFASLIPLCGLGAQIAFHVSTAQCLKFLNIEEMPPISERMKIISTSIQAVKQLCESPDDEDLVCASAVLALTERAVVAALRLKLVDCETLNVLGKSLRFSLNCGDPGMLTALKEQLHLTRTQIDLLTHYSNN